MFFKKLIHSWIKNGPLSINKSSKYHGCYKVFLKFTTFVYFYLFDPFLSPKWINFGFQNVPKSIKKWFRKQINIWTAFGIVFDLVWIPFESLLGTLLDRWSFSRHPCRHLRRQLGQPRSLPRSQVPIFTFQVPICGPFWGFMLTRFGSNLGSRF